MAENITKGIQPTNINGTPIGSLSFPMVPPTNPFKNIGSVEGTIDFERVFYDGEYFRVKHSDHFIDFIVEEFGPIEIDTKFDDMLLSYEMFFDVIDEPTKLNFKKRFVIEKYLDKE